MPSGAVTPVRLDVAEIDNLAEVNLVNYRFYARRAGFYYFHAAILWQATAAAGVRDIYISRNGLGVGDWIARHEDYFNFNTTYTQSASCVVHLNAGDYVTLAVLQATGGNLNILNGHRCDSCLIGYRLA